ncbi:hypothetical protein ACLX1H_003224 [Fusarium chlamydosporum]
MVALSAENRKLRSEGEALRSEQEALRSKQLALRSKMEALESKVRELEAMRGTEEQEVEFEGNQHHWEAACQQVRLATGPKDHRPRADDDEDDGSLGPVKKRGRPSKRDVEQNEAAKLSAKFLIERNEVVQPEQLDELVGFLNKPPDQHWSAEDEARVVEMWTNSDARLAKSKIKRKSHPFLLSLWKLCLRIRKMSPIRLISPVNGFRYMHTTRGDAATRCLYSKPFCDTLSAIIAHPCVQSGERRLVVMLKFAVISRIHDAKAFLESDDGMGCPVIASTIRKVQRGIQNGKSRPLSTLLDKSRREVEAKGERPTRLSSILRRITRIAERGNDNVPEPEESFFTELGEKVLPVTVKDLKNVQRAIDTMEWSAQDIRYDCTTDEALQSYKVANPSRDLPEIADLAQHFERAHKQMLRDYVVKTREAEDGDVDAGTGTQVTSYVDEGDSEEDRDEVDDEDEDEDGDTDQNQLRDQGGFFSDSEDSDDDEDTDEDIHPTRTHARDQVLTRGLSLGDPPPGSSRDNTLQSAAGRIPLSGSARMLGNASLSSDSLDAMPPQVPDSTSTGILEGVRSINADVRVMPDQLMRMENLIKQHNEQAQRTNQQLERQSQQLERQSQQLQYLELQARVRAREPRENRPSGQTEDESNGALRAELESARTSTAEALAKIDELEKALSDAEAKLARQVSSHNMESLKELYNAQLKDATRLRNELFEAKDKIASLEADRVKDRDENARLAQRIEVLEAEPMEDAGGPIPDDFFY